MIRPLATILAAVLGVGLAQAGKLPPIALLSTGFREARTIDLRSVNQGAVRRTVKNNLLSVTSDFNGDGRVDEARIIINNERQIAYVVAVISSTATVDTYFLAHSSLTDAADFGIMEAEPLSENASRGRSGISIVSLKSGQGEANYFDDKEFNIRVPVGISLPSAA